MSNSAEIQRLLKQLAAETQARKKVEAEMQEIKMSLLNRPATTEPTSTNGPDMFPAPGLSPAAPVADAAHLPPTAPSVQDNTISPGNTNNYPNYYYTNNTNGMSNEQSHNSPLNRLLAIEQKWIASDIALNNIATQVNTLSTRIEYQEQYSKLYNLLLHGLANVPEYNPNKATEFCEWVAETINSLLPNLCKRVTADHIDHAHPMRTVKANGNVVIVRFNNRAM